MRIHKASIYPFIFLSLLIADSQAESLGADDALALVDTGQVLPLSDIISLYPVLSDSRLLDIELEREDDGTLIYEFEILQEENLVIELEINASTGQLVREEFEE